jgi:hypothetical protein
VAAKACISCGEGDHAVIYWPQGLVGDFQGKNRGNPFRVPGMNAEKSVVYFLLYKHQLDTDTDTDTDELGRSKDIERLCVK